MGDKKVVGAGVGAIGLGGVAAFLGTCCVTPWAVVLFGATGAVALARLAYLQPYVLGAAALLLLIAFWAAYRRPSHTVDVVCEPGARHRSRRFLWIAALIVLLLTALAIAPSFAL